MIIEQLLCVELYLEALVTLSRLVLMTALRAMDNNAQNNNSFHLLSVTRPCD